MNKQELIEKIENLNKLYGERYYVAMDDVLDLAKQLDEPESGHADEAPRYLKNILARLRELPLHNREVWLKVIVSEFKQDFSHAKWREGYEQGKFDGEWVGNQLKDADKIRQELNKVKVPQFIADKIEYCKQTDGYSLFYAMDYCYNFNDCAEWLESNEDKFARAWLDGYEVENRYRVKMKGIVNALSFLSYHKKADIWTVTDINNSNDHRTHHTRKELEEAGFSEAFNSPLFEVEEVE